MSKKQRVEIFVANSSSGLAHKINIWIIGKENKQYFKILDIRYHSEFIQVAVTVEMVYSALIHYEMRAPKNER